MKKWVHFYKSYLIEDAENEDDAIAKAEEKMDEELDSGWFFPLEYMVEDCKD